MGAYFTLATLTMFNKFIPESSVFTLLELKEIVFPLTDSRDPSDLVFCFIAVVVNGRSG